MIQADIIIVGAGACGLMAGRKLSKAGRKVVIVEARDRLGGRIHTLEDTAFPHPVEVGAEFIHGKLPVTTELLKEAGIHYRVSGGDSWRFNHGKFTQDEDNMENGEELTKRLSEVKQDMTVAAFLEKYFGETEYEGLRKSVRGFVEGYDAADTNRASVLAFRKEWTDIEDWEQFRVNRGYIEMIRFLENENKKNGCLVYLSSIVKEITWQQGHVEVATNNGERYTAQKIIITVPLGVLCAEQDAEAGIRISPPLPGKAAAFKELGFGGVIKILLIFRHPFWKDHIVAPGRSLKNMGWLFSQEAIPTWWTQAPDDSALLTGWLAGPRVEKFREAGNSKILQEALQALSVFFEMNNEIITKLLVHSEVVNWLSDPFTMGAYSYTTPASAEAIKQINVPVENTLFFAGEAFYDGPETGTVEGALANGMEVARQILEHN